MLTFDNDYIDRLNRRYEGGKFIKAAILTESTSPLVKKYFADHEREIVFQGQTYTPLPMRWEGLKASMSMSLEGMTLTVSNLGEQVISYVEELDISGNPVTIQLLHADLLGTLTNFFQRNYNIKAVKGNVQVATFVLGRNFGLNDRCAVMLKSEFPGLTDDVVRIF